MLNKILLIVTTYKNILLFHWLFINTAIGKHFSHLIWCLKSSDFAIDLTLLKGKKLQSARPSEEDGFRKRNAKGFKSHFPKYTNAWRKKSRADPSQVQESSDIERQKAKAVQTDFSKFDRFTNCWQWWFRNVLHVTEHFILTWIIYARRVIRLFVYFLKWN